MLNTDLNHYSFKAARLRARTERIGAEVDSKRPLMVAYLHYREKLKKLKPNSEKYNRNQQKLSRHQEVFFAWQSEVDTRSKKIKQDCENLLDAIARDHNQEKLD